MFSTQMGSLSTRSIEDDLSVANVGDAQGTDAAEAFAPMLPTHKVPVLPTLDLPRVPMFIV